MVNIFRPENLDEHEVSSFENKTTNTKIKIPLMIQRFPSAEILVNLLPPPDLIHFPCIFSLQIEHDFPPSPSRSNMIFRAQGRVSEIGTNSTRAQSTLGPRPRSSVGSVVDEGSAQRRRSATTTSRQSKTSTAGGLSPGSQGGTPPSGERRATDEVDSLMIVNLDDLLKNAAGGGTPPPPLRGGDGGASAREFGGSAGAELSTRAESSLAGSGDGAGARRYADREIPRDHGGVVPRIEIPRDHPHGGGVPHSARGGGPDGRPPPLPPRGDQARLYDRRGAESYRGYARGDPLPRGPAATEGSRGFDSRSDPRTGSGGERTDPRMDSLRGSSRGSPHYRSSDVPKNSSSYARTPAGPPNESYRGVGGARGNDSYRPNGHDPQLGGAPPPSRRRDNYSSRVDKYDRSSWGRNGTYDRRDPHHVPDRRDQHLMLDTLETGSYCDFNEKDVVGHGGAVHYGGAAARGTEGRPRAAEQYPRDDYHSSYNCSRGNNPRAGRGGEDGGGPGRGGEDGRGGEPYRYTPREPPRGGADPYDGGGAGRRYERRGGNPTYEELARSRREHH